MRPNAAAATEQTAWTNTKKFLPTEQPTDAHRSRKNGFNKKTNYASWSTTYPPSNSSKTTEASRQTPEQKQEKKCREEIYAMPNIDTIRCHRTPSTSENPPGKHLEKVQKENWYFEGQKDLANQ
jgi:hypothetical protein